MATGTLGAGGNLATSNDVYVTFAQDTTETQSTALNDTSVDFLTMDSLDWTVEYSLVSTHQDDIYGLGIRIVNGATILAAADSGGTFASVASGITTSTDTTAGPTGFAYVNTGANKATWDGATIELQQTHGQEMGPDGNSIRVDYVTFDITYTANEIVVGTSSSTTETANALQGIDVVSNGSQATTTDTDNAGGIVYPGSTATTTETATTGAADVVVNGAVASTTDTASTGQDGGDYIEPGAGSVTTDTANGGGPLITVVGANPSTTDVASSGQDGGDYIEVGETAIETDAAAGGTLSGNFTLTGQTATTTETEKNSIPKVYEAEGTFLDEHGRHVLGDIDESGNKYFPKLDPETEGSTLNEHGDWVDVTLVINETSVLGTQETTTDLANPGIILSANVVNGDSVLQVNEPHEGVGRADGFSEGVAATTTDTPNAGAPFRGQQGDSAATTDTAATGSPALSVFGKKVLRDEIPIPGEEIVSPTLLGGSATTTELAHSGAIAVVNFGVGASTTEGATSGISVLPGFVRVQGAKRTTTDQANVGGIEISDLRVFGVRVLTQDFPRKGVATGGAVVYRIMLERRVDVLV